MDKKEGKRMGKEVEIKGIIEAYLKENGFDGLYNQEMECGCELSDLMDCDGPSPFCIGGYKRKPNEDEDQDFLWVIGPNKEG